MFPRSSLHSGGDLSVCGVRRGVRWTHARGAPAGDRCMQEAQGQVPSGEGCCGYLQGWWRSRKNYPASITQDCVVVAWRPALGPAKKSCYLSIHKSAAPDSGGAIMLLEDACPRSVESIAELLAHPRFLLLLKSGHGPRRQPYYLEC